MYIYGVIRQLMEEDREIDLSSINNSIPTNAKKVVDKETNGDTLRYLDALKSSPHSIKNLEANVEEIKIDSVRRKLAHKLGELKGTIEKAKVKKVTDLFNMCDDEILNLSVESAIQQDDGQIGKGVRDYLATQKDNGIPLGFQMLDSVTNGIAPGQLMVVVARPKQGKSTLLINWAARLSLAGYSCLYLDTEMSREEQQTRVLSMMTGIAEKKIKNNYCKGQEQRTLDAALDRLEEIPLYHQYIAGFTTESVMNIARKYKVMKNIDILFFDYIKLPDDKTDNPEWLQLGLFTNMLKNKIAGKLHIPVITAAQLNRLAVQATDFDSDQIGGSDRILHLCNYLLAMRRKTDGEIKKHGKNKGNILPKLAYARDCEDGLSFYVNFNKPTLTMNEVGMPDGEQDDFFDEADDEPSQLEGFDV